VARKTPIPDREAQAKAEIGHTHLSRAQAAVLAGVFLAVLVSVPALQHLRDWREFAAGRRASAWPQAWEIFGALPKAAKVFSTESGSAWQRTLAANNVLLESVTRYEDTLEDEALLGRAVLPPTQATLSRLGVGNEKAYIGRDGWLFFRPDVDYVTGHNFLAPDRLRKRAQSGSQWQKPPQPDPVLAIVDFQKQLAARGIELILVPAPTKATIHPEKFSTRYSMATPALQNPGFAPFLAAMKVAGVRVFDPAPLLVAAKSSGAVETYLATDTHWTPKGAALVADGLAKFINDAMKLPPRPAAGFKTALLSVTNLGDIAVMLKLPADQKRFTPQAVEIASVSNARNELWREDPTSDVLFLGDSFCNIYSLGAMGWGEGAGLVEQLSLRLQRPLDAILRNDAGAFATRAQLAAELARGRDRLAGKKLVIWEFAARELAVGDWKLIEMKVGQPVPSSFLTLKAGEAREVVATVEMVSPAPRPGSVPYKDHVIAAHVTWPEKSAGGKTVMLAAVVYLQSMKDNVWTDAARLRIGQQVALKLRAWSDVSNQYERLNRSDLDDADLALQDPLWGEILTKP
jgi:alginate O-acetyltransferase complex protein AlgJ